MVTRAESALRLEWDEQQEVNLEFKQAFIFGVSTHINCMSHLLVLFLTYVTRCGAEADFFHYCLIENMHICDSAAHIYGRLWQE